MSGAYRGRYTLCLYQAVSLRGETLVLCVVDDGPGISETECERAFEPE